MARTLDKSSSSPSVRYSTKLLNGCLSNLDGAWQEQRHKCRIYQKGVHFTFKWSNQRKKRPSRETFKIYLNSTLIHFPVFGDIKDIILLCWRGDRGWEEFGFFHIVCKTVQFFTFLKGRDQLVGGEQTTQLRSHLQKRKVNPRYSFL